MLRALLSSSCPSLDGLLEAGAEVAHIRAVYEPARKAGKPHFIFHATNPHLCQFHPAMNPRLLLPLLALFPASAICASPGADAHWPQWRGPLGNGVAPQAEPPVKWSESENVKWKVAVPGAGTSTPIIWRDRIFLLTAIPVAAKAGAPPAAEAPPAPPPGEGGPGRRRGGGMRSEAPSQPYQFAVLCLDRATGKTLWQKTVRETVPHEGHHRDHGFASALAGHRRKAALRFLRLARALRARLRGKREMGKGFRKNADAQRLRRRRFARAAWRYRHRELGPRRRGLHRRARQDDRQGTLAQTARRTDDLDHAAHRRARRPAAGHRQRHQQSPQPTTLKTGELLWEAAGRPPTSSPRP